MIKTRHPLSRYLTITSVICLSLWSANCKHETESKETIRYYRSIAYNLYPLWQINGLYELSASEADTARFYYKFEFDKEDRIIQITFYKNHKLFNGVRQEFGNPGAGIFRIRYEKSQEIREYYDVFGNPVKGRWGSYKDVYTLDDRGRKIGLEFTDQNGRTINAFNGTSNYAWQWLSDSTVIESRFALDSTFVEAPDWGFQKIKYQLNKRGQFDKLYNLNQDHTVINNSNGVAVVIYNYNDEHQERGTTYLNADEKVTTDGAALAKVDGKFDKLGRYVEEGYYDMAGNLTNTPPGNFALIRTTYSKFDNKTLRMYFDKDNNQVDPAGQGYYFEAEVCDDDGNPIVRKFLNKDRQPVNRRDSQIAEIRFRYDSLHRLVETSYFDQHGAIAKNALTRISSFQFKYGNPSNTPTDTLRIMGPSDL